MEWQVLLTEHLVPGLGALTAFLMFFSPLMAVIRAAKAKSLGSLNPLPMAAMWANCFAWVVYAFLKKDAYILSPNLGGILFGTFMTLTCYGLADEQTRSRVSNTWLFFTGLFLASGTCISFGGFDHQVMVTIWGSITVFVLVVYYAAPLTVLKDVISQRNSAPLYPPLALMSCINGTLWTIYGIAVGDPFVYGPNAVGAGVGVLQLGLIMVLPNKGPKLVPEKPPPMPMPSKHEDLESGGSTPHAETAQLRPRISLS